MNNLITNWEFKKLDKYPNRLICNDGSVYSGKGKPLSLKLGKGGYLRTRMYHLNKETYAWMHRMVCHAFVEDCSGCDVHHIDRDRRNNYYLNLKKLTEKEHIEEHKKQRNV